MIHRKSLVFATILVLCAGGAGAESGVFRSAPLTVFGSRPTALGVGDFDGDDHLDVVTTSTGGSGNSIAVVIGFGDAFMVHLPPDIEVRSLPGALEQGDFDGDGLQDLAVANTNDGSISILKGTGNRGQFFEDPTAPTAVGVAPVDIVSGDIDGDGVIDLVTANAETEGSEGTLSVLLGQGGNVFERVDFAPQEEGVADLNGELGTGVVELADVNEDSILDIIALNQISESLSVFLGNGAATFVTPSIQALPGAQDFTLADVNEDGDVDLVTALSNQDRIGVRLGAGNGNFGVEETYAVGTAPIQVAVHDVTGDGEVDIVAANSRSQDISVLVGNGDGTFRKARQYVADAEPRRLGFGDFNEDGRTDIAVVSEGGSGATVALIRGIGDDNFLAAEDLRTGSAPTDLAVGDVDGNGFTDLVGVTESGGVFVFPSQGEDALGARQVVGIDGRAAGIALADFDGDERLDAAVSDIDNGEVVVLTGGADGRLSVSDRLTSGSDPVPVVAGDFNGDGRSDIATALVESSEIGVFLRQSNGTFAAVQRYPVTMSSDRAAPIDLAVIDADCNGLDDVVVANNAIGTVSVLTSSASGALAISAELSTLLVGELPDALIVADFNSDGRQDVAVSNARTAGSLPSVRFFNGRCDGTLEVAAGDSNLQAGLLVTAMTGRDFVGNQIVDVAVLNQTANSIKPYLGRGSNGNGDGTFGLSNPQFPSDVVSRMPESMVSADFDGDGRYDLAVGNTDPSANNVTVLLNCARSPGCDVLGIVNLPEGAPATRADGNDDGIISAGDVAALAAEAIDGDGDAVEDVEEGTFAGVAGVDANGDGRVDVMDAHAIARRIFAGTT